MKMLRESFPPRTILAMVLLCGAITVTPANAAQSEKQKTSDKGNAKSGESKIVARDVFGIVQTINGSQLTIQTRNGQSVPVDATTAMQAHLSVVPVVGHAVEVRGTADASGLIHAETILHAKDSPALWAADR